MPRLTVNAVWAADDSLAVCPGRSGIRDGAEPEHAKTGALRASVSGIAKLFEELTRK